MLDLENIERIRDKVIGSQPWKRLIERAKSATGIWFLGNGGLYAVAQHGADDITRLTGKHTYSLDSACMLTSLANDNGYDDLFSVWLDNAKDSGQFAEGDLVIGMSCSGTSANILRALSEKDFLWSGKRNDSTVATNICFDTDYYHTCEVLSLILCYELIRHLGFYCPKIGENHA